MSYVSEYLSESSSIKNIPVDLKLEGVTTQKDLEGITHVGTSSFALKTNFSALKTQNLLKIKFLMLMVLSKKVTMSQK